MKATHLQRKTLLMLQPRKVKTVPWRQWAAGVLLGAIAWGLSGCVTENDSPRPWDAPTSRDNGLPQGLREGR